jgi:hypothetical protein
MEDVLDVYQRPYDAQRPVVCLDEKPKILQAGQPEQPPRLPAADRPGRVSRRQDYEYRPQGLATIFLALEPLTGRSWAAVSADRTGVTFAQHLKTLVDEVYASAERIVLVTDNLNTHAPWALYQAFAPEDAHRLLERLEWHYTPEHGSWLNIAEIGLSVLQRQGLNRRFATQAALDEAVQAWVQRHNRTPRRVNWQFTTADARIKLHRLYPVLT